MRGALLVCTPSNHCSISLNKTDTAYTVSPETAKKLIDAGYTVRVEKSQDRIYRDEEFKAAGAEIIETGSWVNAPTDGTIILGLKELPADGCMS